MKNVALYLLIIFVAISAIDFFSQQQQPKVQEMHYTDFMKQVEDGQVSKVVLVENVIKGTLSDGTEFKSVMPGFPYQEDNLVDKLQAKNIDIKAENPPEPPWWSSLISSLLPIVLLAALWFFFMNQTQGGGGKMMSFGRSRAKVSGGDKVKVHFSDVAGADEAKQELEEVVEFLKHPKKYNELGAKIPKGVLLFGPPGTGKTLLAKAVAGEAGVPFFSISGSDFVEMFVGVGASRVRDMFAQAKKNAPCIIFIDEIDAVGRKRGIGMGGGHDEREQTLNQLLVEMDGFEGFEAVIVIAATNRPDVLDPALLRPGRFDRQVVVGLPDVRGREQILNVHVKKVPLGKDVDTATIARGTPGFSGAELANLVNEAALSAARHNKRVVNMEEFEQAKDKLLMGAERRSMAMNEHEKINTAYHEAGHAIVGKLVPEHDPVYKVSIIPRGRALGVTMYLPEQDKVSQSRQGLLSDISTLFAGRIAEELMFGTDAVTTGASNDIERATTIARNMITRWGFSKRLPPMQYEKDNDQSAYLGGGTTSMVSMSDKTALIIDEEVSEIINSCYKRAQDLLEANKDILESMKDALLKYETLDADQIDDLMNRREVRAPSYPKSNNDDNKDKSEDKKDPSAESKAKDESLTKDESDTKEANQNIDDNNKED